GMLFGGPAATRNPCQVAEALFLSGRISIPARTEKAEEEHCRGGQVVLEGVGEEERAHAEGDQRQLEAEPVEQACVASGSQRDAGRRTADDGKEGERRDQNRDEDEQADQPAPEPLTERAGAQALA